MGAMSLFLLEAYFVDEVDISDLTAVWGIMFSNLGHGSSSLGSFACLKVFYNSIGDEPY